MFEGCSTSDVLQPAFSVKVEYGDPSNSKDTRIINVLGTMELPEHEPPQELELFPPKR